jgi:cell division septal protein FtsQ
MGARSKRRRRILGLIPLAGRLVWAGGRRLARRPQIVLLAGALWATGWLLSSYVRRADAFRITQVHLPPDASLQLRRSPVGEHLFALDIRSFAEELHRQQPSLKAVRVIRRLPDTVRVELVPRLPVAQVRLERWHAVDAEGFILPDGAPEPAERLIRLTGFERAKSPLRAGKRNTEERLLLALRVSQQLRRSPALVARRLTEVNVDEPQQIRFVLNGGTEVRCGSEAELDTHLDRLQQALRAVASQPFEVGYIDVRFQEPVIGPRASAMR